MRTLLVALHKYAGLVLGLLLSVIGISGSLLVFDHRLDELLTPATVTFAPSDEQAPYAAVLRAARAAVGGDALPTRIYVARKPGSPHMVRFPTPAGAAGPIEVSVAPGNAEVLAVRNWGEYPVSWVYRLHYTLLSGTSGKYVVGAMGLCLLFFCASGLVIWWPRSAGWRRALTVKRGAGAFRLYYDLHKTAGFYLLPLLAAIAFSGVSLVFPRQVDTLVSALATVEPYPSPRSVPANGEVDVDEAIAIGGRAFAGAELKRVHLPGGANGSYQLYFKQPDEPWSNYAASAVWVDQYSGDVLAVWNTRTISRGSAFLEWQFPLHNGDAFGLAGRWAVFASGWLPALLFGTGVYMWWRKRQRARRGRANDTLGEPTRSFSDVLGSS